MGNETSTTTPNGEMPQGVDPQGETPTITPAPGETPGTTTDPVKELADLKAALKKANAEAATHRHKAKELDELKAKAEADQLTTQQKLEKQLADLQSQYETANRTAQERTINYEVRLHAAQLGVADPNDAVKLLDWSEIDYDDDGNPKNIDDLLKKLIKNKPYLAGKPAQTSGGATNPSRSQSTAPAALTWDVIGHMTPAEYAARRQEINQFMAANRPRF